MEYLECDFEKTEEVASLYGLTASTVRNWKKRGVTDPPWRDPWKLLEWFRMTTGREPKLAFQDRVKELGAEIMRLGGDDYDAVVSGEVVEPVAVPMPDPMPDPVLEMDDAVVCGDESTVSVIERVCGEVGLGQTLARVVAEEHRSFDAYEKARAAGDDITIERREWMEATKVKRELNKTPDAVEVAFRLFKAWMREEWDEEWKMLRGLLGGRCLGLDARDNLLATEDEAGWRRVWDMEMERVVCEWSEKNLTSE